MSIWARKAFACGPRIGKGHACMARTIRYDTPICFGDYLLAVSLELIPSHLHWIVTVSQNIHPFLNPFQKNSANPIHTIYLFSPNHDGGLSKKVK